MTTETTKPQATCPGDYLHIVAAGIKCASFAYYIADQQEKAFAAKAPIDAVSEEYVQTSPGHRYLTGKWLTADDMPAAYREELDKTVNWLKEEHGKHPRKSKYAYGHTFVF